MIVEASQSERLITAQLCCFQSVSEERTINYQLSTINYK